MASVNRTSTRVASTRMETASPSRSRSNQSSPCSPTTRPTVTNTIGAVTGDCARRPETRANPKMATAMSNSSTIRPVSHGRPGYWTVPGNVPRTAENWSPSGSLDHGRCSMFYGLVHGVVTPLAKRIWRPTVEGLENVPLDGPVIVASNHLSFVDSVVIPIVAPRPVVFLAKEDYFTGTRRSRGRAAAGVVRGTGHDPGRPRRHQGGDRLARHRAGDPRPRRGVRHLPRGHPLARRPALPRAHRGRPPGTDVRCAGGPGRRCRAPQRPPARRTPAAAAREGHRAVRRAAALRGAVRRRAARPSPAARSPTRSWPRSRSCPARKRPASTTTAPRPTV